MLAVVFLSGAFVGGFSTRAVALFRPGTMSLAQDANSPVVRERLKRELNLTPDQYDRINLILEDYAKYYGNLQEQYGELQAQMDDVRASGKARIMRVLNEDQRKKFDQIFAEPHPRH